MRRVFPPGGWPGERLRRIVPATFRISSFHPLVLSSPAWLTRPSTRTPGRSAFLSVTDMIWLAGPRVFLPPLVTSWQPSISPCCNGPHSFFCMLIRSLIRNRYLLRLRKHFARERAGRFTTTWVCRSKKDPGGVREREGKQTVGAH